MSDEQPKKLNNKQMAFVDEYVKTWNASEAARLAGYSEKTAGSIGSRLLKDVDIWNEIDARMMALNMGATEALKLQTDIARGDIGVFFRPVDEWMFNPLPEYEILDQKEVVDDTKDPPKTRISYRVFHVVLDMEKVMNPQYSHLIKKFTNSRKNGLSIELYNRQEAIRDALKIHGKFIERADITTNGKDITPKEDNAKFDRAITTLADAVREIVSGKSDGQNSEVDTAK